MAINEVNFFDQNRIRASLRWKWTNKLAWDLTYFQLVSASQYTGYVLQQGILSDWLCNISSGNNKRIA